MNVLLVVLACILSFMAGAGLHLLFVEKRLKEGFTPFLDAAGNLAWKEVVEIHVEDADASNL